MSSKRGTICKSKCALPRDCMRQRGAGKGTGGMESEMVMNKNDGEAGGGLRVNGRTPEPQSTRRKGDARLVPHKVRLP